jgi:hypothetical protein
MKPSRSDSGDPLGAILPFAADASRGQTSASFYCKAALAQNKLPQFLALATGSEVSEGQVVQVACLLRDASIKAFSYKAWNSLSIWPALCLFVAGTLWPIMNLLPAISQDAKVSGLIQTTQVTLAAALFAVYQQYKQKQGRVEDAIRRTLFAHESIEDKIKRLIELSPAIDSGMSFPTISAAAKPAPAKGETATDAPSH